MSNSFFPGWHMHGLPRGRVGRGRKKVCCKAQLKISYGPNPFQEQMKTLPCTLILYSLYNDKVNNLFYSGH